MSRVRMFVTKVRSPTPFWHDEHGVVHDMHVRIPNMTKCEKTTGTRIANWVQQCGYADGPPTCLMCIVKDKS
jgi:hypothetical protein